MIGDLDRGRADAARARVDQDLLTSLQRGKVAEPIEGSEEHRRHRGRRAGGTG